KMHAEVKAVADDDFVNRSLVGAVPDFVRGGTHHELARGDQHERHADGVGERLRPGARGRADEYVVEHLAEVDFARRSAPRLARTFTRVQHTYLAFVSVAPPRTAYPIRTETLRLVRKCPFARARGCPRKKGCSAGVSCAVPRADTIDTPVLHRPVSRHE